MPFKRYKILICIGSIGLVVTLFMMAEGYILLYFASTLERYSWLFAIIGVLLLVFCFYLSVCFKRYFQAGEDNHHSQRLLQQFLDNTTDGILVMDQNKTVTLMNKSMAKMIGRDIYQVKEPVTCKDLLCCMVDGNEITEDQCPLRQEIVPTPFEFDIFNSKNEIINVSVSYSTLRNHARGQFHTIMVVRDQTIREKETLQAGVLEEFGKTLDSPVGMENMAVFIDQKLKALTNCDRVLIFEGTSYESCVLLNNVEWESREINVPEHANLIAQTYVTHKIQEVTKKNRSRYFQFQKKYKAKSFIGVPLVVNQKINGVLLLVYENEYIPELKNRILLKKISTNIAALTKFYKLILETNQQQILNERIYKLGISLQTVYREQDIHSEILCEVKNMCSFDFIAYRNKHNHNTAWNTVSGNLYQMDYYEPQNDLLEYILKWGGSLYIDNFPEKKPAEFVNYILIEKEQLKTVYAMPLIYNNQVLGAILLGSRRFNELTQEREQLIRTLLNILAIHIENKSLYSRIENDATILERQRIAREIHDGLAQNIGFITIQLHRLKKWMAKNDIAKALQEIGLVKDAVDESYVELRETIDQLRDLSGYKESFGTWLKKYFLEFEQTNKIKVAFDIKNIEKVDLNENQRVQMTRVIQEILNNIRKHSEANEVKVYLSGGQNLLLIIEDNGIGFDLMSLQKTKYSGRGIPILHERIQSISGYMHIYTKPSHGTKVEIHVPIVS